MMDSNSRKIPLKNEEKKKNKKKKQQQHNNEKALELIATYNRNNPELFTEIKKKST